jgi:hypothetical protein
VRLKFFNDKRYEAVKVLWNKFCKRWRPKAKVIEQSPVVKPQWVVAKIFEYESSQYRASREEEYWRWMRVNEHYRDNFKDEWYEYQEMMAQKLMKRHHIDRMLIHYNY